MCRVYAYLCYNISLKEGVNIKIINVLKKLSAGRLILLLVVFIFLLSLGTLGLYKKYSKPKAEIGVNPEVKGEIIKNNENKDTQDEVLDAPTTTTKYSSNQPTASNKTLKQPTQANSQPPSSTPSPVTETPVTPPEGSWTNSHGTFKYSDLGKVVPMYLGKDIMYKIGWASGGICKIGDPIRIPKDTKIYVLYSQVPNYSHTDDMFNDYPYPKTRGDFIFDLREYYNSDPSTCRLKYFEMKFSDDPNSQYYPGNLDVWW